MTDILNRTIVVNGKTYVPLKVIGQGGFGLVFDAVDSQEQHYALKRVILDSKSRNEQAVRQEISVLRKFGAHPSFPKFFTAFEKARAAGGVMGKEIFIVTELCEGGSVADAMQSEYEQRVKAMQSAKRHYATTPEQPVLSTDEVLIVVATTVTALSQLHAAGIAHRDVKAQNILMRSMGSPRPGETAQRATLRQAQYGDMVLCDFGSSSSQLWHDGEALWASADSAHVLAAINRATTPAFRSPELIDQFSHYPVTTALDIWALGVMIYQLSFGQNPFGDSGLGAIQGHYTVPPDADKRIVELLKLCFIKDPRKRATAPQIAALLRTFGVPIDRCGPLASTVQKDTTEALKSTVTSFSSPASTGNAQGAPLSPSHIDVAPPSPRPVPPELASVINATPTATADDFWTQVWSNSPTTATSSTPQQAPAPIPVAAPTVPVPAPAPAPTSPTDLLLNMTVSTQQQQQQQPQKPTNGADLFDFVSVPKTSPQPSTSAQQLDLFNLLSMQSKQPSMTWELTLKTLSRELRGEL